MWLCNIIGLPLVKIPWQSLGDFMSAPANEQETKGEASVLRVAILGSGPSGSALACMLARQGAEVTLFEHGRRPELVVGESLVPAVIPMLRRLGIEKEIAAIGLLKPGASFVWSPTDRFSFTFARFAPAVPPYAYNVPRPRFDEVLLANAVASGARVVRTRARVERASRNTGTELRLDRGDLDRGTPLARPATRPHR